MAKVTNSEVIATLAGQQLDDLAKLEGANAKNRPGMFVGLTSVLEGDDPYASRNLDTPDAKGYTPSKDIAHVPKK